MCNLFLGNCPWRSWMHPMWDDSPSPQPNFQAKNKKLRKITSSRIHSPLLGDEVDYGTELIRLWHGVESTLSYQPAAYVAWRAGAATLSHVVNFLPPVRDNELGLSTQTTLFLYSNPTNSKRGVLRTTYLNSFKIFTINILLRHVQKGAAPMFFNDYYT
jgi:hypothetical protein